MRFKTPILILDLCDYRDAYIVLKVTVMVGGTNYDNKRNENLTSNNIATFRSCISNINNAFTGNADLDLAMSMYNLLECSDNSMTSGSFWNYYRDEINDDVYDRDQIN